jgi:hypothetical protein
MSDMNRKTKKQLSGQVRVDPKDQDQEKANEIIDLWETTQTGSLSMKDIFRAGLRSIQQQLQGA